MFGFFRKRYPTADFLRAASEAEPERRSVVDAIQSCRAAFGSPPRSLSGHDADGYRLAVSSGLEALFRAKKDDLLKVLAAQDALRDRGKIFWGHLVQANKILFGSANQMTLPANVIYGTDPFFDGRVSLLSGMARNLFAQKGSKRADPEMQQFVDAVTDERMRVLRREMPRGYTGGRQVFFATFLIQPSHLPGNRLKQSFFPLVVNAEETEAVMILPSRYWPATLLAQWRD